MRASKLFGKTLRQPPAEVEFISHNLMLRAGMIYQVSSGVYSYLPTALRSLRKIETILREEMENTGAEEVRLSVLQPKELWERSGRADNYGPNLFSLLDRRQKTLVLAPTHEELLTLIVKDNINSYRDLPTILYQIQTKFRDELRPRGGLIRVREFDMKDAYSFDATDNGLDQNYEVMVKAYKNIFSRCGLQTIMVEADSGAIGGKDSHEFVSITDSGEDTIIHCISCGYAANGEKAQFSKSAYDIEAELAVEKIDTPGVKTIVELCDSVHIEPHHTIKTLCYIADNEIVLALIRGDLDINQIKLGNILKSSNLRLATHDEVRLKGFVPGSVSPVGIENVKVIADESIHMGSNFVIGSNSEGHHFKNVNYPRDFQVTRMDDIAMAQAGHSCSKCKSTLKENRGVEVGHVFKLGTRYSEALEAYYLDNTGLQQPVVMGCYGIGVGRLLAAIIDQNHDDRGIIFPLSVAPFQISLIALNIENDLIATEAEALYKELRNLNLEVLYDDRRESAGVKFKDADLLGLPLRLIVSQRNLNSNVIEVVKRSTGETLSVPRDAILLKTIELLKG